MPPLLASPPRDAHGVALGFSRMIARLESLRDALRALPDEALIALRHDAIDTRYLAPSFTAWIKHMVDWELDRRTGNSTQRAARQRLVTPGVCGMGYLALEFLP